MQVPDLPLREANADRSASGVTATFARQRGFFSHRTGSQGVRGQPGSATLAVGLRDFTRHRAPRFVCPPAADRELRTSWLPWLSPCGS